MTSHSVFGDCVSGAGDVNADGYDDMIVGSGYFDPGGVSNAGSVFVYSGVDGSILYQWDGAATQHFFGVSASGAGDVNADGYADLIVGAMGINNYAGATYVYSGVDGSLMYSWSGTIAGLRWGQSVSDAGDVNNDGFDDVMFGAPYTEGAVLNDVGAVYVHSGATGALIHEVYGLSDRENLGEAVSGAGDVNGDGFDDFMAGAPHAHTAGPLYYAGLVYVYSGATGAQLYQWSGDEDLKGLGQSISDAGDVNGDGFDDMIVGYLSQNNWPGAAHLYSGADGSELNYWLGAKNQDWHGYSVSGAGDVNGDGSPDVIVGAYGGDTLNWDKCGSAYVYGFESYLHASTSEISASAGGVLDLEISFPVEAGTYRYKVLISQTGIGPTNYGVDIPLTQDSLVMDTYAGNYPVPTNSGLQGTLDALGNSNGSLSVPAGIPSGLIGNVYYMAAIAFPLGSLPEYSSAAVLLTITP